jgi:hypothetical protein
VDFYSDVSQTRPVREWLQPEIATTTKVRATK